MPASKSSHSGILAPSGGGDLAFRSYRRATAHIEVSGDENSKLFSGTPKIYQSGGRNNVQTECPAEIDGNAKDEVEDRNAPEIHLAIDLMKASRAELSLATLDTVVFILRSVIDERQITPGHPLYISSMSNLASALGFRFIFANQLEDFVDTYSLRRKIIEACNEDQATGSTDFIFRAQDDDNTEMAMGFLVEFQKSIPIHVINTVVFLLQRSLPLLPAKYRERFSGLTTLAFGLYNRFYTSNDISDLDDAISSLQDALKWCVDGDLQKSNIIRQIFCVFAARFDATKDILDLRKGFSWFMQANIPAASLRRVALSLWTRYKQGHQRVDIDAAIFLLKRALDTPHDGPSTIMINLDLGAALLDRFQEERQQTDLDEAISLFRRPFGELRVPSNPQPPSILIILASALSIRFKRTGQQSDIDEAISLRRQGLEPHLPFHPKQLELIQDLAIALETRFEQTGQQDDIDEAISLRRQGLELLRFRLPSHPEQHEFIQNLASALFIRFNLTSQQSDIDESISLRRQILKLLPPSHPERPKMLGCLALELSRRFFLTDQNIDLDDAISLQRQAVVLNSSLHSCKPFTLYLNILAYLLVIRFGGGQQVDIIEAISLLRQNIETDPNNSLTVRILAISLSHRFGPHTDIDEGISLHRQIVAPLSWSDPKSFIPFDSLATSLLIRFWLSGQKTDLDEGISIFRQCFKTTASYPLLEKSEFFHHFATALTVRYNEEGQQSDFDDAYSLFKQVIDLRTSHDDTSLPDSLAGLGGLCFHAHSRSGGETSEYLEEATSLFIAAAQYPTKSALHRLRFAKTWIAHAELYKHPSVFNAYEAALQALPQAAALSLDIQSRQEGLADFDGLARNAARCAIRAGNLEKAIEFLEGGQSVFWSQVLSLRSPFSVLHDIAPGLANKLQDIATALELGSHRDVSRDISNYMQNLSKEEESSRLNRLNEEWEISIDNVRRLEGFEDFLRPRRLSALRTAASTSPVVILVANRDSHCLILTSTTIHHIDLPRLHTRMLQNLVRLVQVGVSQSRVSRSSTDTIVENINTFLGENRATKVADNKLGSSDDVFRYVLGILWDDIINPVIRLLKIQKSESGDLPVLKWCPTGLFNFLPIHAAGRYNDDLSDECASDYFISSYTPTIGALLLHNSAPSAETFKMMVVIESSELPSTETELKVIEQHVPIDMLIKMGVAGRPAEVEAVASLLPSTSIVHFACHGTQDRLKPLDSGLKLNDGRLRISRIMKETITNQSLAFLCACETAMGDKDLPDEAISLGASLLFSGFHRVIATMWQIMDSDGPTIADGFYEDIFRGPDGKPSLVPDITRSAQALHASVKKLRDQKVSFRRWVPFIHMGQ